MSGYHGRGGASTRSPGAMHELTDTTDGPIRSREWVEWGLPRPYIRIVRQPNGSR